MTKEPRPSRASSPRVLVVDDDPACRRILRKLLEKDGCEVLCAADGHQGLAQAQTARPDLVLCDWMMPGLDGPRVCQAIRADPALKDTFFIFLTALEKSYIEDGIAQGADDFITKPIDPREVSAKVKAGLRLSQNQKTLLDQAHRDGLTGAYNWRYWEHALRQAGQGHSPFLVAIVDVDGFKEINDRWGHGMGDAFLQELVRALMAGLQEGEILARLGGDEFACLLRRPPSDLKTLKQRTEIYLTEAFPELPVGLSLGHASYDPERPVAWATLMAQADRRLYRDKHRRRPARR